MSGHDRGARRGTVAHSWWLRSRATPRSSPRWSGSTHASSTRRARRTPMTSTTRRARRSRSSVSSSRRSTDQTRRTRADLEAALADLDAGRDGICRRAASRSVGNGCRLGRAHGPASTARADTRSRRFSLGPAQASGRAAAGSSPGGECSRTASATASRTSLFAQVEFVGRGVHSIVSSAVSSRARSGMPCAPTTHSHPPRSLRLGVARDQRADAGRVEEVQLGEVDLDPRAAGRRTGRRRPV